MIGIVAAIGGTLFVAFVGWQLVRYLHVLWLNLGSTLFRSRPIAFLVPAAADDPEWRRLKAYPEHAGAVAAEEGNPYASPAEVDPVENQLKRLIDFDFRPSGLYLHAQKKPYALHYVPHMTDDRRCLAVCFWGKVSRYPVCALILFTPLSDGRFVASAPGYLGLEDDGVYVPVALQNATLEQLLARHWRAVAETGRQVLPFALDDPRRDYEAIVRAEVQCAVDRGLVRYVDPEQTHFRSTLRGVVRAFWRGWRTPDYVERIAVDGGEPEPLHGRNGRAAPALLRFMAWTLPALSFLVFFAGMAGAVARPKLAKVLMIPTVGGFVGGLCASLVCFLAIAVIERKR